MSEGRKEPLTHAGLIAHKLAIEARAEVIGEQSSEDAASLKTLLTLLHYEIASNHVVQQMAAAKVHEFFDFARPEPTDAGPHATGWRCTLEGARMGNLSLRAQDRVVRAALALQRLYTLIGGGNGGGPWTWERPDWLDAFPEMTPENLAKANAAQEAADERRRREAEEAAKNPKLHATPGQRRGHLKNGNPAGDYMAAPRCNAHARSGHSCRQPAMANGRCRFHGGLSTGPRTAEGLQRSRTARFVHGARTAEIIDLRAYAARHARRMNLLLAAARAATPSCHARESGHPGHASAATASAALDPRLRGDDNGEAAPVSAGHGVDRPVSPAPLESAALNHRDTACLAEAEAASPRRRQEAQSDRVARIIPLHQAKTVIARASSLRSRSGCFGGVSKPALEPFKAPQRVSTAPQHLRSPAFAKPAPSSAEALRSAGASAGEGRSVFICGSKPSSRRNALLASAAAFTSPLSVFAPLRFNPSQPTAAGHGLHRSLRRAA